MKNEPTRLCQVCQSPIRGRTDKKFCDDVCRNNYHNSKPNTGKTFINKINNTLKRNRTILESFFSEEDLVMHTRKEDLQEKGFVFRYHTHFRKGKSGEVFRYCYDYGYAEMKDETCLIVRE